jgi:hypothetical protein
MAASAPQSMVTVRILGRGAAFGVHPRRTGSKDKRFKERVTKPQSALVGYVPSGRLLNTARLTGRNR